MQKYLLKHFLVLCLLLLASYGCLPATCDNTQGDCLRILFIGNSYTFVNDLPNTFAKLAYSGDHQVEVGMLGEGGWTLADQINSPDLTHTLLSSKWDDVIVQEQSQIPSVEESRNLVMYPAARVLIGKIRDAGANPIFFETWAHRDGMPENGMPDFEAMQYQIDVGYLSIAQELNVPVAPVGDAWFSALKQNPQLGLWQQDGSHPTEQGTYLAACVFYAVIFQESPQGLSYLGNVPAETAHQLQDIAARKVLNIP